MNEACKELQFSDQKHTNEDKPKFSVLEMDNTENSNDKASYINKLLLKRVNIRKEIRKVEKEIFKYETLLLETSQGSPVTKSLEYYSSNRTDRKKYNIKDSDRIFSKDIPPINE